MLCIVTNILVTWYEELTPLKRPWCWERLRAGGEGDNRWWDGLMASPTQWTWVWVNSRSWWWTGRPGMLRFMWSQIVIQDWVNWTDCYFSLVDLFLPIPHNGSAKKPCLPISAYFPTCHSLHWELKVTATLWFIGNLYICSWPSICEKYRHTHTHIWSCVCVCVR